MSLPKPLSNLSENARLDLIWEAILGERYQIEVQRTTDVTADLCVFDTHNNNECLMTTVVVAPGQLDSSQIFRWQNMVIDYLDERLT